MLLRFFDFRSAHGAVHFACRDFIGTWFAAARMAAWSEYNGRWAIHTYDTFLACENGNLLHFFSRRPSKKTRVMILGANPTNTKE